MFKRPRLRVAVAIVAIASAVAMALVPSAAYAAAGPSHTFTKWTQGTSGTPDYAMAADQEVVHSGAASLRIDYESSFASSPYAHIYQDVTVTPGQVYEASAWVRGQDVSQAGAVYFVVTDDHSIRAPLPGGTYDWQKITWQFTAPADRHTHRFRLLARGPATVWIDDVQVVAAGESGNLLTNPGFESFDLPREALDVVNDSLMFAPGQARVEVSSYLDNVAWELRNAAGQSIADGNEPVVNSAAAIDIASATPGYYELVLKASSAAVSLTRTVSLGVLDTDSSVKNDRVGASTGFKRDSVAEARAVLPASGLGRIRFGASWTGVEKTRGVYTFPADIDGTVAEAQAAGIRPLMIIAYNNPLYDGGKTPSTPEGIAAFAAFAQATAEHYGDGVDYEIFNEYNHTFNTGDCGRTPECYVQLLGPASAAIREAAPGARVVGPVLAGDDLTWFEGFFAAGGLELIDVLSYHTYDFPHGPEGRTHARVAGIQALLHEYAPDRDVPIWITEHGWTTQTGVTTELDQARFLVRAISLFENEGVEQTFIYSLMNTGNIPTEKEDNFGIVRSATGITTALQPKPSYVALSVLNRLTAGRDLGRECDEVMPQGAHCSVFDVDGGAPVRMLWATTPTVVRAELSDEVAVTSLLGQERTAGVGGADLELALGADPVYLSGDVDAIAPVTEPWLTLDQPGPVAEGAPPHVTATVATSLAGDFTLEGPAGESAAASSGAAVELDLRPSRTPGMRSAPLALSDADGTVRALAAVALDVRENPSVQVLPTVTEDGATHAVLRVSSLPGAERSTISDVSWTVGEEAGVVADSSTVEGGSTIDIPLSSSPQELWRPLPFTVDYAVDGVARKASGTTVFTGIRAEGAGAPAKADLAEDGKYVAISGSAPAPQDASGQFWATWSEDALTFRATITDQAHQPGASPGLLWQGDSLQLGLVSGFPRATGGYSEIGAALLTGGGAMYNFSRPDGVLPGGSVDVTRSGTTTEYRLTIPWDSVGIDPSDGFFSMSVLLNDADGNGREGWYEWGGGIGAGKDVSKWLPVQLTETPPDAADPTVSLVDTGTDEFEGNAFALNVEAADDRGLDRIVGNIYQNGALLASTTHDAEGARAATLVIDLAQVGAGGLARGDFTLRYNALDTSGNLSQTKQFAFSIVDTVRPLATLVSPDTAAVDVLHIQVDASDAQGLERIVANVYRDGEVIRSTQTPVNGAATGTHTATVDLPAGAYDIKYNSRDLAGNTSRTGVFSVTVGDAG